MNKADFKEKEHFSFSELCDLVSFLRSPEGCSWDYAQTHKTIRNNFVEEAYEVCEGIDQGNNSLLCEELGDVLFQVLFHTDIAEKEGAFGLGDVIDGIAKKMISRHPHVFDEKISGEDPLKNWEEVKKAEKGEKRSIPQGAQKAEKADRCQTGALPQAQDRRLLDGFPAPCPGRSGSSERSAAEAPGESPEAPPDHGRRRSLRPGCQLRKNERIRGGAHRPAGAVFGHQKAGCPCGL